MLRKFVGRIINAVNINTYDLLDVGLEVKQREPGINFLQVTVTEEKS